MIMPRGSDQLLLPVNPLFIGFTLLGAMVLEMLPNCKAPHGLRHHATWFEASDHLSYLHRLGAIRP